MPGLDGHIQSKFEDSENGRRTFEQRWLQAYKNFRGIYDSSTQYRDSERSKVFIKITKTKVLAAYGQIIDILFPNTKFPIVVESSPVPDGIVEFAHLKTPADQLQSPFGFPGDGLGLEPGETEVNFGKYNQMADQLAEGPSKAGEPQFKPAEEAAAPEAKEEKPAEAKAEAKKPAAKAKAAPKKAATKAEAKTEDAPAADKTEDKKADSK